MKNKAILVSFVAFLAIIFALNTVLAVDNSATYINNGNVQVTINDIVSNGNIAGEVSRTIPVEVRFTATEDMSDVTVRAYIDGYKSEISGTTGFLHIVKGSSYIERFSLTLPSSTDLDNLTEDMSLFVRISAKGEDSFFEKEYPIVMQKDSYSLNILSVEAPQNIVSGSVIALDVVLENNGDSNLENVYVKASIPELGAEKTVYFGDIKSQDNCDNNENDCDNEDTVNGKLYLSIPSNAVPGTYNIQLEAYNYDTKVVANKKVIIGGAQTGVLPTITSKAIAVGEETSFDIVLVNPNDKMMVYSITPEESKGLIVTIDEPIVALSADSSKTVKVNVKATSSADEGTHLVTVNVNSEDGLVKQVNFSVNVEKQKASSSVFVLTVILAIIFVVLLIVLIVLLAKKPTEVEETNETSYY